MTKENLTREQLIGIGVNPDNLVYPNGEMNIVVQLFGSEDGTRDSSTGEKEVIDEMLPDIYQPRRNRVHSCGCEGNGVPFATGEDKADFVKHLRDSAERLKIMSHYLSCQANEIEEFGYPKTTCYYPE